MNRGCSEVKAANWILTTVLLVLPTLAMAFGAEGHRITGYVAESLLTSKARIRLHQITDGATLDQIATYMDDHRNELGPRIRRWHYDNDPVCYSAAVPRYCPSGDCASVQIDRWSRVLSSPASGAEAKREAVFYLAHLIGDIHQPLHAADNGDRGGNDIQIAGRSRHPRNLHSMWDSDFVKRQVRGSSEPRFAEKLLSEYADRIAGWQAGDAATWMAESHRYARDEAYGLLDGFSCASGVSPAVVTISPAYRHVAERRVREQLAKAGARLAYVLNQALDRVMP